MWSLFLKKMLIPTFKFSTYICLCSHVCNMRNNALCTLKRKINVFKNLFYHFLNISPSLSIYIIILLHVKSAKWHCFTTWPNYSQTTNHDFGNKTLCNNSIELIIIDEINNLIILFVKNLLQICCQLHNTVWFTPHPWAISWSSLSGS